jgi:hypothetical protein
LQFKVLKAQYYAKVSSKMGSGKSFTASKFYVQGPKFVVKQTAEWGVRSQFQNWVRSAKRQNVPLFHRQLSVTVGV